MITKKRCCWDNVAGLLYNYQHGKSGKIVKEDIRSYLHEAKAIRIEIWTSIKIVRYRKPDRPTKKIKIDYNNGIHPYLIRLVVNKIRKQ